jgi:hypothetical protein
MLKALCERAGIDPQQLAVAPGLDEPTQPETVIEQIKAAMTKPLRK